MTRSHVASLLLVLLGGPAFAQATMEPPEGFERVDLPGNDEVLTCMTGGSGTPMILLHGWPQTAAEWKPILGDLAAVHTVYACDLPGVRDSTNADEDYTKAGMADDVHAAMASAGIGPVHLVGHDIGLMVAYAYASAFPDDVASLAIMDAPLPGTPAFDAIGANPSAWHFVFHAVPEVPEAVVGNSVEFYLTHFIEELWKSEPRPTAEQIAPFVEAYSDPDTLHTGFEWYRAFPQDAEDNAAHFDTPLPMPVLALSSGELTPTPYVLEMMEPLAEDVRGGAIEGSGHWLAEEVPDMVADRLLALTAEVEGR